MPASVFACTPTAAPSVDCPSSKRHGPTRTPPLRRGCCATPRRSAPAHATISNSVLPDDSSITVAVRERSQIHSHGQETRHNQQHGNLNQQVGGEFPALTAAPIRPPTATGRITKNDDSGAPADLAEAQRATERHAEQEQAHEQLAGQRQERRRARDGEIVRRLAVPASPRARGVHRATTGPMRRREPPRRSPYPPTRAAAMRTPTSLPAPRTPAGPARPPGQRTTATPRCPRSERTRRGQPPTRTTPAPATARFPTPAPTEGRSLPP